MSGRGRHRRQRSSRLSRIPLMLTAGGAGIVLPFAAVGTAVAVPNTFQSHTVAEQAADATAEAVEATDTATDRDGAEKQTHTVETGDTLGAIAAAEGIKGGWVTLHELNLDLIGADPDLILPGQELTLDGESEASSSAVESGSERADRTADRTDPAAESGEPGAEAPEAEESGEPGGEPGTDGGFVSPVDAAPSTAYGVSGALWGSGYHTGVDFSAASGTPISAVAPGTVVTAGWGGSYGNEVVIEHADGHYTQYAHLSGLSVSAGQQVGTGDEIGLVGSTGNSTGPHLHFEVRTGPDYGADIDPLGYLRAQGVTI